MNTITLKQEVTMLRSAVIGLVGRDTEGSYNPTFVESTLAEMKTKPTKRFKSVGSFLKSIDS